LSEEYASAAYRTANLQTEHAELRLHLFYPATAPEHPTQIGPYLVEVALDVPPADGTFPLVVVSHGSGGSGLTHRGLATYLARHGFVVLLPEHPGNNRDDNRLAGTHALLERRPRDVSATLDWAFQDPELAPHLIPGRAAVIGHSLGGYTALALAGGRPWAAPHETPDHQPRPVPVTPDPRVKALVLLAPAAFWFAAPGALQEVRVPILLLTGEHDRMTPASQAEVVKQGVSAGTPVEHRTVPNAGHFSFLTPFPPERCGPDFPPSQDPPGFDRTRFHEELYPQVEAFLRTTITA
jgi:predicted dienelactone hydrolase